MRVTTTTTSSLNSAIRNGYREKKVSVGGVVGISIRKSVGILRLSLVILSTILRGALKQSDNSLK